MHGAARAPAIRLLLDEHYPVWLAAELGARGINAAAVAARSELRGSDDREVLELATVEGRVVVTEDVTTFSIAIALVPDHVGVIYCHHARFPRTRPGLCRLRDALIALLAAPPEGLGALPVVWWPAHPIP